MLSGTSGSDGLIAVPAKGSAGWDSSAEGSAGWDSSDRGSPADGSPGSGSPAEGSAGGDSSDRGSSSSVAWVAGSAGCAAVTEGTVGLGTRNSSSAAQAATVVATIAAITHGRQRLQVTVPAAKRLTSSILTAAAPGCSGRRFLIAVREVEYNNLFHDIFIFVDVQHTEAQVLRRMKQQHGLVSRAQARAEGMTARQIERRIGSGHWVRELRGVYRHAAMPATPLSRMLAAWMAFGGLASHRSAAALHRIDGYQLNVVELSVTPGSNREVEGVRFHQSTQLDLARPVVREGILTTGRARTVLDVAAIVPRKRLDRTIDAVLRDGQLRLRDLWEVLASHARRGRPGCAALKASLQDRFGGEPVPLSEWSRMVAGLLADEGLDYPALEHCVHDACGAFVAQVDLAYPEHRVAIELDSARWHDNRESFVEDRRRRNEITLAGWDVLNFTWDDYVNRSRALCSTVIGALANSGH